MLDNDLHNNMPHISSFSLSHPLLLGCCGTVWGEHFAKGLADHENDYL